MDLSKIPAVPWERPREEWSQMQKESGDEWVVAVLESLWPTVRYLVACCGGYARDKDHCMGLLFDPQSHKTQIQEIIADCLRKDEQDRLFGLIVVAWRNRIIDDYRKTVEAKAAKKGWRFSNDVDALCTTVTLEMLVQFEQILAAIEQLPEIYRLALELMLAGYSHEEIAEMTGCTVEASRKRRHDAIKRLRDLLTPRRERS